MTRDVTSALLLRLHRQILASNKRLYARLGRRPGVAGGQVCLYDTGVMAVVVAGRFFAGDSVGEIAADYRASRPAIEQAIRLVANARRSHRSPEAVFEAWIRRFHLHMLARSMGLYPIRLVHQRDADHAAKYPDGCPDWCEPCTRRLSCKNGRHEWPKDYVDGDSCYCGRFFLSTNTLGHRPHITEVTR